MLRRKLLRGVYIPPVQTPVQTNNKTCESGENHDTASLRKTYNKKEIIRQKSEKKKKRLSLGETTVDEIVNQSSSSLLETFSEGQKLEAVVLGAEDDLLEELEKIPLSKSHKKKRLIDRQPAWQDEEDDKCREESLEVRDTRYRKLAKIGETSIKKAEYQERLKKRFEVVHGEQPSWADLDLKDTPPSNSEDEEEDILQKSTGDYLSREVKVLAPTYLDYKPVTAANKQQPHKTTVSTVRFHPTSQVVMTAGKDHHLSFFQVDGVKNSKIQTLHIEKFPIFSARFTADGSSVVLSSRHKSFYQFDMVTGDLHTVHPIKALGRQPMSYFEVSPCGNFLAFRGEYGFIHILSMKSKEMIGQLKMNGEVNSICFSPDGGQLYSFGDDAEVYVWDMKSRSCIHRFTDEGCLMGTSVATDCNRRFLACGSESGVVNIYDVNDCMTSRTPKPLKVINNLLTSCTSMTFNSTSQLLAIGSKNTERSVKLVNLNSLSVYQNYPSLVDTMKCPTDIDFSPSSGYITVATNKGLAHMYSVAARLSLPYIGYSMRHRWGIYTLPQTQYQQRLDRLPSRQLQPLRVGDVKLFLTVNGLIASVTCSIKFTAQYLDEDRPAVFLFPLSYQSTLHKCDALITQYTQSERPVTRTVGLYLAERNENNNEAHELQTGVIIEQSYSHMTELQLGIISPDDVIEIKMQYSTLLSVDEESKITFVFPTYLPRALQSIYSDPYWYSEETNPLTLKLIALISGNYRVRDVTSSQPLDVRYTDHTQRRVKVENYGRYCPAKDFSLSVWYDSLTTTHIHVFSPSKVYTQQTNHWLLNSYCAHLTLHHSCTSQNRRVEPQEFILCLDRSASMCGEKIACCRDAITYFVKNLPVKKTHFNIISYGSTVRPLFSSSRAVSTYSISKAMKLRKRLKADMLATNINALLEFILSQPNATKSPKQIYLVTDGAVEHPDLCIDMVEKASGRLRLFTFGLDRTASKYLVSGLARAGNGKAYHIANTYLLKDKVLDAMRLSTQPSITDLRVRVYLPPGFVYSTQPQTLPTVLYSSETLSASILINYTQHGKVPPHTRCRIELSGVKDGKDFVEITCFDLADAFLNPDAPLHHLTLSGFLSSLDKELRDCDNVDDIMLIQEEKLHLSFLTNIACDLTHYISMNKNTGYELDALPVKLVKPEDNLSKLSSLGIDVFKSNQVLFKSLINAGLSTTNLRKGPAGALYSKLPQRHQLSIESEYSLYKGQKYTDQLLSRMGGVRLAEVESLTSCPTIMSNMDSISEKYNEDTTPVEIFNIIEEYSASSLDDVSPERYRKCKIDETRETTVLGDHICSTVNQSHQIANQTAGIEKSVGRNVSSSDYYSMEISPLSDKSCPHPYQLQIQRPNSNSLTTISSFTTSTVTDPVDLGDSLVYQEKSEQGEENITRPPHSVHTLHTQIIPTQQLSAQQPPDQQPPVHLMDTQQSPALQPPAQQLPVSQQPSTQQPPTKQPALSKEQFHGQNILQQTTLPPSVELPANSSHLHSQFVVTNHDLTRPVKCNRPKTNRWSKVHQILLCFKPRHNSKSSQNSNIL